MTLVPSLQFYPTTTTTLLDSFQSSVSKLHVTTRLQFFRYGSSTPFKNQNFCATNKAQSSDSLSQRNPQGKSNFVIRNKDLRWGFSDETPISQSKANSNSSSSSWLDKWNDARPKPPRAVLNYRNSGNSSNLGSIKISSSSGGDGGGGGSTMEKIVEKLKKFGYMDDVTEKNEEGERVIEKGSVEDIFYVEEGMLPNPRGGFSAESPLGVENVFGSNGEVRFPWEKPVDKEEEKRNSVRQKSRTCLAELTLPESELRRLKNLALRLKNKTRIGGAGVTQAIVDLIHEKWKSSEVVRLKIEGAPALNMKRMHDILERKTGGLVIWRSGTSVSLYRGVSYKAPSERANKKIHKRNEISQNSLSMATAKSINYSEHSSVNDVHTPQGDSGSALEEKKDTQSSQEVKYEDEIDELLDSLGPRYTDWPGGDLLPVDADLLPGIVPGYQPPFRVLPYGVRATLSGKEATALRRLARVLPPHFALGRSRQHQGLAVAMIKLWERSSIAKIALKRGVQLTTSERMAEDIKKLTGSVLLSRNKDFLVFYRGKNFLSPEVAEALLEKERLAKTLQDEEEQARLKASALVTPNVEINGESRTTGTLEETLDANARWGKRLDDHDKAKVMKEAEVLRHADLVRKLERKLAFAERKLMKAERTLSKVEESLAPADRPADPDSITDEERFMFRKLGLRMKAFLLLGRRGVFDGTVENMHLHWKYRELVKIIVKAKSFDQVKNIALSLESESGGVLVSVDKVSKGYAIIVFRGKDYHRPSALRPKNLLTKRKALARSIELQRREALLNHISTLETRAGQLRSEIEQMDFIRGSGDEELYDKLDSAYPTEDEDSEDEGDEAYLDTSDTYNDGEDEIDDHPVHNHHLETNFPYDFQDQESEEPGNHNPYAVADESSIRVDEMEEKDTVVELIERRI